MWTWFYKVVNFLARIVFFSIYPRKVYGREHMPASGPVLVVCNHLHFHDIFNVATSFQRRVVIMGKQELYKNRLLGYLFRKYGSFSIDRSVADLGAIRTAMDILRDGGVLVMFPEGTRRRDGTMELGEIKKGAVLIAKKTNAQILPMYISTKEKLFRPMVVNIGKPYALDETSRADSAYFDQMAIKIRGSMLALRVDPDNYKAVKA